MSHWAKVQSEMAGSTSGVWGIDEMTRVLVVTIQCRTDLAAAVETPAAQTSIRPPERLTEVARCVLLLWL